MQRQPLLSGEEARRPRQGDRDESLHVGGATAVDAAVAMRRAERIARPVLHPPHVSCGPRARGRRSSRDRAPRTASRTDWPCGARVVHEVRPHSELRQSSRAHSIKPRFESRLTVGKAIRRSIVASASAEGAAATADSTGLFMETPVEGRVCGALRHRGWHSSARSRALQYDDTPAATPNTTHATDRTAWSIPRRNPADRRDLNAISLAVFGEDGSPQHRGAETRRMGHCRHARTGGTGVVARSSNARQGSRNGRASHTEINQFPPGRNEARCMRAGTRAHGHAALPRQSTRRDAAVRRTCI